MKAVKRGVIVMLAAVLALGVVPFYARAQADDETPWLGVAVRDTDDGVTITNVVPDSPADDAGLAEGQVIVAVDETEIETSEMLVDVIRSYAPGDEVVLTVLDGDEAREITVALAELPDHYSMSFRPQGEIMPMHLVFLGLDAEMTGDGLLVNDVLPDSVFADTELQAGDLITAINGEPVGADHMFPGPMVGVMRDDEPVVLAVVRDGEEFELEVELDRPWAEVMPFEGGPMPFHMARGPMQLGVQFQTITPDLAADKDLPVEEGALIVEVFDDSPAAEAELQAGDVIVEVGGDVLDEERTLADRLVAYEEGDVVTFIVLRDGEELDIAVTLGPRGHGFGRNMRPFQVQPGTPHGFFFGPGRGEGQGERRGHGHRFGFDFGPGRDEHPFFFAPMPFMDGMPFGDHFFDMHPFLAPDAPDPETETDGTSA